MLDIKKEIQVLLVRKGQSMTKMINKLKNSGLLNTNIGSFSRRLSSKTIKFETVQVILDYLGYEIVIKEKEK